MNANYRERLKDKKRIVIKIGSSSLIHSETGRLDFRKLEILARELSDLHNQGSQMSWFWEMVLHGRKNIRLLLLRLRNSTGMRRKVPISTAFHPAKTM